MKKAYDAAYHKAHIKGIYIPFNMNNPDDVDVYEMLKDVKNKARYIKELVARDFAEENPPI